MCCAVLFLLAATPVSEGIRALTDAERRAAVTSLSREELAVWLGATPPETLLELSRRSAAAMGAYSFRLTKQERVSGILQEQQTLDVIVRERPYAVRLECVAGPPRGRKVVYDETLRKDSFRVQEAGFLGLAGGVWIGVHSSLARVDTNYAVTAMGFSQLLDEMGKNLERMRAAGGVVRTDEGFDEDGNWCIRFETLPSVRKHLVTKSRVCFDPVLALPVDVEVRDAQGLRERLTFRNIRTRHVSPDFFTPAAAGI